MPAAPPKNFARGCAGQSAVIVFDLPVHDREINTFGQLIRLCKSSVVNDGCWIEDGDIRKVAGP